MKRSSQVVACCGTFVLASGFVTLLASFGAGSVTQIGVTTSEARAATSLAVNTGPQDAPRAQSIGQAASGSTNIATEPEAKPAAETTVVVAEPKAFAVAALPDASQIMPPDSWPELSTAPDAAPEEIKPAVAAIVLPDDCLLSDVCVDQYLWAFYERTPKQDTNKVHERRKVTIKRKGKTKIVTRRFTRLVDADFTWKDPHAAQRVNMPMINYVIGGMDKRFKRKLLVMLVAAEAEGLLPGITSGFRDDYRQAIASGQKAASHMSYHGGSFRGGYGHGVAADLVSVKGKGRSGRWVHSAILWKWIDERGKDFGIGRPYLNRDPPHVAPIDGREYAAHYRAPKPAKMQVASAAKKKVQVADAKPKAVAAASKKK